MMFPFNNMHDTLNKNTRWDMLELGKIVGFWRHPNEPRLANGRNHMRANLTRHQWPQLHIYDRWQLLDLFDISIEYAVKLKFSHIERHTMEMDAPAPSSAILINTIIYQPNRCHISLSPSQSVRSKMHLFLM